MFEGVGRSRDEEATRRGAQSLVATSLLGFLGACGVAVVIGAAVPVVHEISEVDDFTVGELVAEAVEIELLLPPPPKARRSAEPDTPTEPTTPEPDAFTEPQELRDEVKTEVAAGGGTPDGDPDGDPDGFDNGTTGGSGTADCGDNCGGDANGPKVVHWTEVQAKRRVTPEYPDRARDMDLGEVSCKVLMTINERGRPTSVSVQSCPAVFHESAQQALMKWSFYPAKSGGKTVPAQFLLNIRYKIR